jgi:S1-C subfamily serine protease
MANLLGLVLGSAVGGAGLIVVLSRNETAPPQSVAAMPIRPAVPPSAPRLAAKPPAAPALRPPEPPPPPLVAAGPPLPAVNTLPNIIYPNIIHPEGPSSDDQQPHKPGTAVAGTGFFVASDGTFITAAHVVSGCRQTRIASPRIKPANARLLATDATHDVALLRANVTPPATLPVGRPAGREARLFVLGYPAGGDKLVATETWAVMENDKLPAAPAGLTDSRRVIWVAAPEINHGFSGGPMLDPRNGAVVGIVRGMIDSKRLHSEQAAIPASGVVIGPGSAPLAALLEGEGTYADTVSVSGDDALEAARRATVHVLCLY